MRTTRDDGYFPRDSSILRRIHAERAVGLLYGQRALMIGALNPRAFVGTLLHTRGGLRPFKRLAHTGKVFETIYFGTRQEADEVLAFVHRMHDRVNGEMPADAGVVKAGERYSAFDPDLMLWTMAVIADSAPFFYELLSASSAQKSTNCSGRSTFASRSSSACRVTRRRPVIASSGTGGTRRFPATRCS